MQIFSVLKKQESIVLVGGSLKDAVESVLRRGGISEQIVIESGKTGKPLVVFLPHLKPDRVVAAWASGRIQTYRIYNDGKEAKSHSFALLDDTVCQHPAWNDDLMSYEEPPIAPPPQPPGTPAPAEKAADLPSPLEPKP